MRADADVVAAEIMRPRFAGCTPSDHDPVTAVLRLTMGEVWIEITDLGTCRSCAGRIAREIGRLAGVVKATLHATESRIEIVHSSGVEPSAAALADLVRASGYTPGRVEVR